MRKTDFVEFYRFGGGGVPYSWAFGWLTGIDNDLVRIEPKVQTRTREHKGRPLTASLEEIDIDLPYGSMYAVSKLANELHVHLYRELFGVDAIACRPARVWGPGFNRWDLPILIERLVRDTVAGQPIKLKKGGDKRNNRHAYFQEVVGIGSNCAKQSGRGQKVRHPYWNYLVILAIVTLAFCSCAKPATIPMPTPSPEQANVINLPEPQYDSDVSIEQSLLNRKSIRSYTSEPLTLQEVSQLLWAALATALGKGWSYHEWLEKSHTVEYLG